MGLTKTSVALPNDVTAAALVPSELDPELVKLALTIFMGGLIAVAKCENSDTKRQFLIRYVASLANCADTALHSAQMANKMDSSNQKQIVEDLLKSLH